MKRRNFLKYLGFGTAATVVGTFLLENPNKVVIEPSKDIVVGPGWIRQIEDNPVYEWKRHPDHDKLVKKMRDRFAQYPLTPEQSFKKR